MNRNGRWFMNYELIPQGKGNGMKEAYGSNAYVAFVLVVLDR